MRLEDRVVLVTGGSRGIGRAIALRFVEEGAKVVVNYTKNKDKAEEVVGEITKRGGEAIAIRADVSKREEVAKMVNTSIDKYHRIDILVNNAGIGWKNTKVLEADDGQWEKVLETNLFGTYFCIHAVVPYMVKQRYGKIINLSSVAGVGITGKRSIAYEVSKNAINILTKKLSEELGEYNIYVNAIAPGLIDTDILRATRSEDEVKQLFERITRVTSLKRVGMPKDIAGVAIFLASDDSSFVTGQVIVADGGRCDYSTHSV